MARTEHTVGEKQKTVQSAGGHSCTLSPSLLFPQQISGRIGYILLHKPPDSPTSGFLMLWADRNLVFVPTDMRERTKCVQRLLERSRQDKGSPGQRWLAAHWGHWEVAAGA